MSMYFFPPPYKDELMYSVLARYCVQSGNRSSIQNFDDLFGTRKVMSSIELQGNLERLIANMPINSLYSEENFIFNNTLFPYLASFTPKKRAKDVIEIMKRDDLSRAYNKLGLTASDTKRDIYFRFCPKCVEEDMKKYGETYWHRLHQIPGVFICPEHEVPIYDSQTLMRGTNRQSYTAPKVDNLKIYKENEYSYSIFNKLLKIAKDVESILNKEYTFQSTEKHKYIYMDKLIKMDIANLNTMVHQKRLKQLMLDYWGKEVLELVQHSIDISKRCAWLQQLVIDSGYMIDPLSNLLLASALGIDIIEILDSKLDLEKTKSHKKTWEDKLIELSSTGLSLRKMSRILDSTSQTLKKHIERLGIEPFWEFNGGGRYINKPYKETEEYKDKLEESKRKWMKLIKNNPKMSKSNLSKLDITLFSWLLKYDKGWLDKNTPDIKNDYDPVHWKQRDNELLPRVKKVIDEMLEEEYERICWGSVGSRLGVKSWFVKNKDRLPKVKLYIEKMEESHEEFQIRKIKIATKELENEGANVTKWNIATKSGVNIKYIEKIENGIDKLIERW